MVGGTGLIGAAVAAGVAVTAPLNGRQEIAGPEQFRLDAPVRSGRAQCNDSRGVVCAPKMPSANWMAQSALAPGSTRTPVPALA